MLREYRIEFAVRTVGHVNITCHDKDEAFEIFNEMDPEDLLKEAEYSELTEYDMSENYPE